MSAKVEILIKKSEDPDKEKSGISQIGSEKWRLTLRLRRGIGALLLLQRNVS